MSDDLEKMLGDLAEGSGGEEEPKKEQKPPAKRLKSATSKPKAKPVKDTTWMESTIESLQKQKDLVNFRLDDLMQRFSDLEEKLDVATSAQASPISADTLENLLVGLFNQKGRFSTTHNPTLYAMMLKLWRQIHPEE